MIKLPSIITVRGYCDYHSQSCQSGNITCEQFSDTACGRYSVIYYIDTVTWICTGEVLGEIALIHPMVWQQQLDKVAFEVKAEYENYIRRRQSESSMESA